MPTPPNPPDPPSLQQLINRPKSERRREYRYRFAQTLVFGLPVIALAVWGPLLGPTDWQRWSTVLQALLTGWILYINLGLLLEPIVAKQHYADLAIIVTALVIYLWSIAGTAHVLLTGRSSNRSALYCICVAVLSIWNAVRWLQLKRPS